MNRFDEIIYNLPEIFDVKFRYTILRGSAKACENEAEIVSITLIAFITTALVSVNDQLKKLVTFGKSYYDATQFKL